MAQPASDALSAIFLDHRDEVLEDWIASQQSAVTLRHDLLSKAELRRELQDFLDAAAAAAQDGSIDDVDARGWERGRDYLASLSRSRAIGGFSPSETATFVLSLKQPVVRSAGGALRWRRHGAPRVDVACDGPHRSARLC